MTYNNSGIIPSQEINERLRQSHTWLSHFFKHSNYELIPLAGDASFRRYFRVKAGDNVFILMDAPPSHEDSHPFIHIASLLKAKGLIVPAIIADDLKQGFLLLSDFGDRLLIKELNEENVGIYYPQALKDLLVLQGIETKTLPVFDHAFMMMELERFEEWYLTGYRHFKIKPLVHHLLQKTYQTLIENAESQTQVFIHRDYHSRNLMILGDQPRLGILDFQDAMRGPITYDLVSLLKECDITWSREKVIAWALDFFDQASEAKWIKKISPAQFIKDFEWMGLQRHLKVVGIYSRLYLRDSKSVYLKDLPRVFDYFIDTTQRYPEFREFAAFLNDVREES
jgi:aminoglycoside/choline kinase family phosphotransferase